jgi:hypothetical protein
MCKEVGSESLDSADLMTVVIEVEFSETEGKSQ